MYKKLALLLLSIGLIAGILYLVGFDKTASVLMRLSLGYFLLLLLIQLATMILSALKWRLILRHNKVSFTNLLASTFVGYLINNINPMGMAGGEPVKAFILSKKEKMPTEKAFASVVVDLFLEIFPIFILSAIAIFLVLSSGVPVEIAFVIAAASLALLVLFALSVTLVINREYSLRMIGAFTGLVARIPLLKRRVAKIRSEMDEIYGRFNDAMKRHMLDNYILVLGTFISMSCWFLRILRVYVAFKAVGVDIPIPVLVIVEAVAIVVTFFPILPGAIGVWEGTSIALFVILAPGVSAAEATTVALIDRVIFYIFPSILGIFAALFLGIDIFKLAKEEVSNDKVDLEKVSKVIGS